MQRTRYYNKIQVVNEIDYLYRDEDEARLMKEVVSALPFKSEYGSNIENMLRNQSEHELASALFPSTR